MYLDITIFIISDNLSRARIFLSIFRQKSSNPLFSILIDFPEKDHFSITSCANIFNYNKKYSSLKIILYDKIIPKRLHCQVYK